MRAAAAGSAGTSWSASDGDRWCGCGGRARRGWRRRRCRYGRLTAGWPRDRAAAAAAGARVGLVLGLCHLGSVDVTVIVVAELAAAPCVMHDDPHTVMSATH